MFCFCFDNFCLTNCLFIKKLAVQRTMYNVYTGCTKSYWSVKNRNFFTIVFVKKIVIWKIKIG